MPPQHPSPIKKFNDHSVLSFDDDSGSLKPLFIDDSFNNIKPIFRKNRRRKKRIGKRSKRKVFKEFN